MHNSATTHGDKVNKWDCHPLNRSASGDAFARVSRWVDGGTCCLCQQPVKGLANLFVGYPTITKRCFSIKGRDCQNLRNVLEAHVTAWQDFSYPAQYDDLPSR